MPRNDLPLDRFTRLALVGESATIFGAVLSSATAPSVAMATVSSAAARVPMAGCDAALATVPPVRLSLNRLDRALAARLVRRPARVAGADVEARGAADGLAEAVADGGQGARVGRVLGGQRVTRRLQVEQLGGGRGRHRVGVRHAAHLRGHAAALAGRVGQRGVHDGVTGVRVHAQVLALVGGDPDPVHGRVEVEAVGRAGRQRADRPGDRAGGARRGVDHVDAAGLAQAVQLAGGGPGVQAHDLLARGEAGQGVGGVEVARRVRGERQHLVRVGDRCQLLGGGCRGRGGQGGRCDGGCRQECVGSHTARNPGRIAIEAVVDEIAQNGRVSGPRVRPRAARPPSASAWPSRCARASTSASSRA